jgi:esterase/lipase
MQEFRSKEVYGDLYENGRRSLVVVLGGSKAGIPSIGKSLSDYLTFNYSVLLLAYFGVGSLPKTLERVPVEYFVNAVNLARQELRLGSNQVVLIGNSKGGEIALLLSKHLESIATIACVPGCYVFQGLPVRFSSILFPKSSWSLKGRDLPYQVQFQ